jgi:hypothetical protein
VTNVAARLIILSLSALLAWPAQADPPATMHRIQAGSLDASGWTDAISTEGGFSTHLPCLFNDFSINDADPQSTVSRGFALGCQRADGSKFSVWRFRYRGGATAAQILFDEAGRGAAMPGAAITRLDYAGAPALDLVGRHNDLCGWMRLIRSDTDNILLIVEGPPPTCGSLGPMATRFFAALTLRPGHRQ